MPLVTTEAIVLHTYPYGESSKVVRMATPEHGVMSAMAKGAHRPRSRFGARLQPLSEGTASVYVKANRDLQTLAEFDVARQRGELARSVAKYGAATAVAEVVLRCSPHEPHPHVFDVLRSSLDWLIEAEEREVDAVGLAAMWSAVVALGFAPAVSECAVDGARLGEGPGAFSILDGGFVCPSCARSRETSSLGPADRAALADFVAGRVPVATLSPRHAAAHRRLVSRFVRRHVADDRELRAVEMWEQS